MRKIIVLLVFITNICFSMKWYSTYEIEDYKKYMEIGDIILYKPQANEFSSSWGHNILIIDSDKMVDFPYMNIGYRERPIDFLKEENREFILLRYRYINNDIRKKILKEVDKYLYYKYFLFPPLDIDINTTYCSHFVYLVYKNVVGDVLEYDHNIVRPFNFLWSSKYFEVVDFEEGNR